MEHRKMNAKNAHIQAILHQIPEKPGVYQYFNKEGVIIYVGKAKNLKRRVTSYFQKEHQSYKTAQLVKHIVDIKYIVVDSEQDAFLLENNLIKQYQPRYNILLKDGKSYPSICITKEPYPRIIKTRQIIPGRGEYYGPYSFGNTVDMVLELIHQLFPIRTCTMPIHERAIQEGKYKPCLKYHLHNCCGICADAAMKATYTQWIDQARKIIQGDAASISKQLETEMYMYAEKMEYEQAAKAKERYMLLEKFQSKTIISNTNIDETDVFGYTEEGDNVYISMLHVHNGSITRGQVAEYSKKMEETREEMLAFGIHELREQLSSESKDIIVPFMPDVIDENWRLHVAVSGGKKKLLDLAMQNVEQYKHDQVKQQDKLNPEQRATRILSELQNLLKLPSLPVFIDSFDNSHIAGTNAVGGCVVFKKGKPSKSDYKRFQIKTEVGGDDYASMREVVKRRYERLMEEGKELPNLIIADGGIGQMHAIREVVEEQLGLDIPVVGLKKNDQHRTQTLLYGCPPMEVSMPVTSEVFRLMVQIQDEVHRFAISYHQKRRSKVQTKSQLDDIQGVGPQTKQKILLHFGSAANAKRASKEELQKILGNNRGSVVYEYFQADLSR